MRRLEEVQVFQPEDIDLLQSCFDHIINVRALERKSPQAETVAKALLAAFQSGVRDRRELITLADIKLDS